MHRRSRRGEGRGERGFLNGRRNTQMVLRRSRRGGVEGVGGDEEDDDVSEEGGTSFLGEAAGGEGRGVLRLIGNIHKSFLSEADGGGGEGRGMTRNYLTKGEHTNPASVVPTRVCVCVCVWRSVLSHMALTGVVRALSCATARQRALCRSAPTRCLARFTRSHERRALARFTVHLMATSINARGWNAPTSIGFPSCSH